MIADVALGALVAAAIRRVRERFYVNGPTSLKVYPLRDFFGEMNAWRWGDAAARRVTERSNLSVPRSPVRWRVGHLGGYLTCNPCSTTGEFCLMFETTRRGQPRERFAVHGFDHGGPLTSIWAHPYSLAFEADLDYERWREQRNQARDVYKARIVGLRYGMPLDAPLSILADRLEDVEWPHATAFRNLVNELALTPRQPWQTGV